MYEFVIPHPVKRLNTKPLFNCVKDRFKTLFDVDP